jgi:hypothetical protein
MKKIILCFLFFSGPGFVFLQAQSTIPASGGNATGSGGSVSYTVGQVTYQTLSGTNGTVVQGVQQPYEISIVTALEEAKDINLVCSVYPNPTIDFLTLKVGDYENKNMSYWLYGVNGNLIVTKKILSNETQISMGNQVSGTYFLKVTSGNKELKTFKIIKN